MKNILRLVTQLLVYATFSVAYGDNHDPNFGFTREPNISRVELNKFQGDKATISFATQQADLKCQGKNSLWMINAEDVQNVVYDIRWQYKIEEGEWHGWFNQECASLSYSVLSDEVLEVAQKNNYYGIPNFDEVLKVIAWDREHDPQGSKFNDSPFDYATLVTQNP